MSIHKIKNQEEFNDLILNSKEETIVVDFFGEWCQPCKKLLPILEEFATETQAPTFKVDIDDCPNLAKRFGIKSVPTVLSFKNGEVQKTVVGLVTVNKLKDLL